MNIAAVIFFPEISFSFVMWLIKCSIGCIVLCFRLNPNTDACKISCVD